VLLTGLSLSLTGVAAGQVSFSFGHRGASAVFEEAARLIRQMDEVLGSADLDPRAKVRRAFELSVQVSAALHPFYVEHKWKLNPWSKVNEALGPEPLRHEDKINDVLAFAASGDIPNWCFEWWRAGKPAEPGVLPDRC
jgi:hypothetical protein